jgi:thiamine pyrophosphate-dependent acetolactate synthase large subunit-like protein
MTQIKIGDYLFKRLRELGIESVFGVPGGKSLTSLRSCHPRIANVPHRLRTRPPRPGHR